MRGKAVLIAAAVVLNCSINVFADTSLQEDSKHAENTEVMETSVAESAEEDTAGIDEALPEKSSETIIWDGTIQATEMISEENSEMFTSNTVSEADTTEKAETIEENDEIVTSDTVSEVDTAEIIETLPEESSETHMLDKITEENTIEMTETQMEESSETYMSDETTEEDATEGTESLSDANDETITSDKTEQEEIINTTEEQETVQLSEECHIYNVSLPTKTMAYLDPGNLSGRGQIYSDQYVVENHGDTDVAIKIKNIDIVCHSTENVYEFLTEEVTDNQSMVRKLNVNMVWKNETENIEKVLNVAEGAPDACVLLLKAAKYDENGQYIGLNDGSTGTFCFTGTLNSNMDIVWEDNDITVHFNYEIVCAEETESLVSGTEEEETQENTAETENTDLENTETETIEMESTEIENTESENIETETIEMESTGTENTGIENIESKSVRVESMKSEKIQCHSGGLSFREGLGFSSV